MPVLPSYRNQSIDNWFLYEANTGNEWVKLEIQKMLFSHLKFGKSSSVEITSVITVSGTKKKKNMSSIYSVSSFFIH